LAKSDLKKSYPIEMKEIKIDAERWLEDYGDYLYRYALMQLKNESMAEDVVQDALLSAYRARDQFEGRSSVKTWLTTILRNKIIDQLRKKKKESIVELDSMEGDGQVDSIFNKFGTWNKWLGSWGSSPELICEQQDFMNQLSKCLSSLPENLRQVFILRNVDNLSTEEICTQLDISSNNVWVILYRSRMKLRECLELNWYLAK
jgi:RNA polymerase sigma-70 factor (ECF subfamily)